MALVLNVLAGRLGELRFYDYPQMVDETDPVRDSDSERLVSYQILAMYELAAAEINLVLTEESESNVLYSMNVQVLDTTNSFARQYAQSATPARQLL
jgi:hypothetical protein